MVTFFHSAGLSPRRKGTDLVLRAFSETAGNARLVVHTQMDLGRTMPELRSTMSRLVKEQRLEVITRTVPAPGLYHLGDVYVYPSRLDGIGLTLAEALACGLPAITCDNPPMNEFVNGSNGWLVPVARLYPRRDGYYWEQCEIDVSTLSRQMQHCAGNSEHVIEMKRSARAYAVDRLDWRRNSEGLREIFAQAAKRVGATSTGLRRSLDEVLAGQNSNLRHLVHALSPRLYSVLKDAHRRLVPLRGE
jgi:glycosyltransferase involved in cell wall biosynthesis